MEQYICPRCWTDMKLKENGSLLCPKCYLTTKKSTYDFIYDFGMHDARMLFREEHNEEHNEEPPNPNAVVLTRDEVMCSAREKFVCQFRNGIETQFFSAKEVAEWLCGDKYVYGETWRCWSDMPSKQQEKETPWEKSQKPQSKYEPSRTYLSARICELCEAIKQYSTESDKHNKIALWCKEIMYLNEMDRDLRYEEKRKVWREEKGGELHDVT